MKRHDPAENTGAVLGLAMAAWLGFAATANLDPAPLATFGTLFAALTYVGDRHVHEYITAQEPKRALALAVALAAALPFAFVMVAPAAAVAALAAIEIAVKRRLRSARATSRGASPAAL
jgi:hypothetical protein